LLQAKITGANISDKEGAIRLLLEKKERKLKIIWGDSAYQGVDLKQRFSAHGIDLEVVKRPSGRKRIYNEQWRAEWIPVPREFNILPRRWVVERTYAWMGRNRRLSKDYEFLPEVSEACLYAVMSKLLLRRLNN
jgi:transposase